MKLLFIVIALCCVYGLEVRGHDHDDVKRQVATVPAAGGVTESPADTLMRLKLMTYEQKLKAKEEKKKAKAEKKAQKDAAFTAYMSAIAAGAMSPAAGGAAPAPGGAAPLATVVPPMPMLPAMGLWKKSFLLSQVMAAAAAQNAKIAAAAAAAASTTPSPTSTTANDTGVADEDDSDEEDQTINEIVKRYAPILRKKFYGAPHYRKYEDEEEDEEVPEVDDEEQSAEVNDNDEPVTDDDEDEDTPAGYQSGSFNKFGTGPAGSPNGVGYEDAKVNQAGCSGSHIHICSGTTVYLTNPDEVTNDNPLLQNPEFKAAEPEREQEEEEPSHPKFGKKRGHGRHH